MPARNVRDARSRMLFGDVVDGVMRLDAARRMVSLTCPPPPRGTMTATIRGVPRAGGRTRPAQVYSGRTACILTLTLTMNSSSAPAG